MARKFVIALVVGGAYQACVRLLRNHTAHCVVHADVPVELQKQPRGKNIIKLPLGQEVTLAELAEGDESHELADIVKERSGADLDNGLMRNRKVGFLALEHLINSPDFAVVVDQLLRCALVVCNGTIGAVEIKVFASGAGGTGGPCAAHLATAIEKTFLDHGAKVTIHMLRVGPMAYLHYGRNVFINSGVTAIEDYNFLFARRHQNSFRFLHVVELPLKGNRDAYASQFLQCFFSRLVQEQFQVKEPNESFERKPGAVTILRASFWHQLSPYAIAGQACHAYRSELDVLSQTPPDAGNYALSVTISKRGPGSSIDSLVEDIKREEGVQPERFDEHCREWGAFGHPRVLIVSPMGRRFQADNLRLEFPLAHSTAVALWVRA